MIRILRRILKWLDGESNVFNPPTLYADYMARWRKRGKRSTNEKPV